MAAFVAFLFAAGTLFILSPAFGWRAAREARTRAEPRPTRFLDLFSWMGEAVLVVNGALSLIFGVALVGLAAWLAWRTWI
jgi:hypothetical protein